MVVSQHLAEKV
jgi:hypothetical protein